MADCWASAIRPTMSATEGHPGSARRLRRRSMKRASACSRTVSPIPLRKPTCPPATWVSTWRGGGGGPAPPPPSPHRRHGTAVPFGRQLQQDRSLAFLEAGLRRVADPRLDQRARQLHRHLLLFVADGLCAGPGHGQFEELLVFHAELGQSRPFVAHQGGPCVRPGYLEGHAEPDD